MRQLYSSFVALSLMLISCFMQAQDPGDELFDETLLHEIRINFSESDFWDILTENYQDNSPFGGGGSIPYLMATSIEIDGVLTDSVGVRQKGFSSHFSSGPNKKSLKVDVNTFVSGKKIDGLKKFNLHNGVGDPAFQRDLLCYNMMRKAGIRAPRVAHTKLYLNDQYWGVYALVEQIDKTFLVNNFDNGQGTLYKNMGNSGLEWLGNIPANYASTFEIKTNETENDWAPFIDFVDILNNSNNAEFAERIDTVFNVDYYLRVLAIDFMTDNWDSYIDHGRNYYMYHEPVSDLFYWIPWDYNLAMGGSLNSGGNPGPPANLDCGIGLSFTYVQDGTSVDFTGVSDIPVESWSWNFGDGTMGSDSTTSHDFNSISNYNVCLTAGITLSDTLCEQTYCASVNLNFNPADCPTIQNGSCPYPATDPIFQQVILADDFCCSTDWDNLCQDSYDNIANGGTNPGGPGGPPIGFDLLPDNSEKVLIKRLFSVPKFRDRYLDYSCEILANNFTSERLDPIVDFHAEKIRDAVLEDPFYVFSSSYFDYDVGDGNQSAGGATIPPLKPYIASRTANLNMQLTDDINYDCENLTAGLAFQDVTINELLASNDSTGTITDPAGQNDDWIELYNNTDEEISLNGYYLTDDPIDLRKWPFPAGTTIDADGYLIVWADGELSQSGLHANFKLSKAGEDLLLVHSDGSIIDQVTFGEQATNLPIARIPNGTGNFVAQAATFNFNNESTTSTSDQSLSSFQLYPNPTQGQLSLVAGTDWELGESQILIRNVLGQLSQQLNWANFSEKSTNIDLQNLDAGIYFIEVRNGHQKRIEKVILQ